MDELLRNVPAVAATCTGLNVLCRASGGKKVLRRTHQEEAAKKAQARKKRGRRKASWKEKCRDGERPRDLRE